MTGLSSAVIEPAFVSPADKAELAKYGLAPEDIGRFDNRDPLLKQVGGSLFKFNRETGGFEQTDLPQDGTKEPVDFVVTGQDGKPHSYKVSPEKAAAFQVQQNALGMRVDLERELHKDTIQKQVDGQLNHSVQEAAKNISAMRTKMEAAQVAVTDANGYVTAKPKFTPEAIQAKIDEYVNMLPAQTRKQLSNR